MNLDPIADYLAANSDLAVGVDLFTYSMPPFVDAGVLLVAEMTHSFVDHEMPGIFKNRYQAIVRDSVYDTGKARADEIFAKLYLRNVDLGEYVVTYSRPLNQPIPFSRSEGDLVEFSVNFEIRYRS